MSGIVGIIHFDGASVDPVLLQQITAAMAFRGPDAQHVHLGQSWGFGHALLCSTFEARQEQQPCSLDGQVWLTADARIDGRAELIRKLRSEGSKLSEATTDAALILHAYHAWGEACLDHLIGDFAFALWDDHRQRLFCARDPFGVVPFYYVHQPYGLAFSNTLNVLHGYPEVSDRLNEQAIGDYLLFGHNQDLETTFFQDIYRLPPAHALTWSVDKGLSIRRYLSLSEEQETIYHKRPETYAEHFRELFQQAVADRLRTDRVVVSMSGGLDSSAIAVTATALYRQGQTSSHLCAYCSGFDWLMPDHERYYASLVAQHAGIEIHYLSAENFLVDPDPDRAWFLPPEPRFSLRPVPAGEIILRLAAQNDRVILTGLGGDPILASPASHWLPLLEQGNVRRLWSDAQLHRRLHGKRPPMHIRKTLKRWVMRNKQHLGIPPPAWLNPDFSQRLQLSERLEAAARAHVERPKRLGLVADPFWSNALSAGDPEFSSLPVKHRHPFFDLRLLKFLLSVPSVPWFSNKMLLREAMKGMLPEPIRTRAKTPLQQDFFHALATRGLEVELESLATASEITGYVDQERLVKAVRAPANVKRNHYLQEVLLPLSLAHWLHNRHRLKTTFKPRHVAEQVLITQDVL